jgi:Ni/Fe-hydrogenase subunit HybB-like protein
MERWERLPYGVGQFSWRWYLFVVGLMAGVGWAAYAYSVQLREGLVVTGLRDWGTMGGATWGLYIAFLVYFVGVSFAGIVVAALIRLLRLEFLRPLSRAAELMAIISLLMGSLSILPDVGQPLRALLNLPLYARPQSPLYGDFTLIVAGYLFASLVYFYLAGRRDAAILTQKKTPLQWFYRLWAAGWRDTPQERARHERVSFFLALAILPLLVTAHSTLGFIFGLMVGRPGWFSALQAPGFVVMAGVSGVGMLILIAACLRRALGETERLSERVFRWLSTFLMVLVLVYLYFMVVELLTSTYTGHSHEVQLTLSLLWGEYAWLYWGAVGALVGSVVVIILPRLPRPQALPAFQPRFAYATGMATAIAAAIVFNERLPFVPHVHVFAHPALERGLAVVSLGLGALFVLSLVPLLWRSSIASAVVAGLLVNVAAIAKRVLIVVPSQTHGGLLPYGTGSYTPTWVEYSIVVGLFALGTLLYSIFVKVFPIMEIEEGRS